MFRSLGLTTSYFKHGGKEFYNHETGHILKKSALIMQGKEKLSYAEVPKIKKCKIHLTLCDENITHGVQEL